MIVRGSVAVREEAESSVIREGEAVQPNLGTSKAGGQGNSMGFLWELYRLHLKIPIAVASHSLDRSVDPSLNSRLITIRSIDFLQAVVNMFPV